MKMTSSLLYKSHYFLVNWEVCVCILSVYFQLCYKISILFMRRKFRSRKMATTSYTPSKFVSVEDVKDRSRNNPSARFRLVSFNILAQAYVKSENFPHSPSSCLRWKSRSQAIITTLKNLNADFFCLQELDEYETFYKPTVESLGYSCIYIQRSGTKRDGSGIFFKKNCALLLMEEKIRFNDLLNSIQTKPSTCHSDSKSSDGDLSDPAVRFKRDCVGVMAAFKLNAPSNPVVIIANAHLYWDPELADVKLAQAKYLLSRLAKFNSTVSAEFASTPGIILAGDFNSTPGDKVYQFLVSGDCASANAEEELPIPLRSSYGYGRAEPLFTNCTPGFTGTLDYIFFNPLDELRLVSLLELPQSDSQAVIGGLPNFYFPSDHLPIGAEFELTTK